MEIVETIKLRIKPPKPEQAALIDDCVRVNRALWNWLVAMDQPHFQSKRKAWAAAYDLARHELLGVPIPAEGAERPKRQKPSAPEKTEAFRVCVKKHFDESLHSTVIPLASPQGPMGKGGEPMVRFEVYLRNQDPKNQDLIDALARITAVKCRSVVYETLTNYKNALKAAQGYTKKGKARKGGKSGSPQFLTRAETDLYASVAWQVQGQGGGSKRPTVDIGEWRYVRKGPKQGSLDRRGRIYLKGSLGWVHWRDEAHRLDAALKGGATTNMLRVLREGGCWHVCFDVTYSLPDPEPLPGEVGIDRGITVPFALSTGELLGAEERKGLRKLEKRKKRLQRRHSRQVHCAAKQAGLLNEDGSIRRGSRIIRSKRMRRVQQSIAKQSAKIARHRGEWHAQTACAIAQRFGMAVVEGLGVKKMTRSAKGTAEDPGRNVKAKAGLNREILAVGWSGFRARLDHALKRRGGVLIEVDPAYTSQSCNACGKVNADSRNKDRFRCVHCGHEDHADLNAAKNILERGLVGVRNPEPTGESQSKRVEGLSAASATMLQSGSGEARNPGSASAATVDPTPRSARMAQAIDLQSCAPSVGRKAKKAKAKASAGDPALANPISNPSVSGTWEGVGGNSRVA